MSGSHECRSGENEPQIEYLLPPSQRRGVGTGHIPRSWPKSKEDQSKKEPGISMPAFSWVYSGVSAIRASTYIISPGYKGTSVHPIQSGYALKIKLEGFKASFPCSIVTWDVGLVPCVYLVIWAEMDIVLNLTPWLLLR